MFTFAAMFFLVVLFPDGRSRWVRWPSLHTRQNSRFGAARVVIPADGAVSQIAGYLSVCIAPLITEGRLHRPRQRSCWSSQRARCR